MAAPSARDADVHDGACMRWERRNPERAGPGKGAWCGTATRADTGKVPGWGFSGSPLVVGDVSLSRPPAGWPLMIGHRCSTLARPNGSEATLPAVVDHRRSSAGAVVDGAGLISVRGRRRRSLEARLAGRWLRILAADPDRGWRRSDRERQRWRRNRHAPPRSGTRDRRMDRQGV